MMDLRSEKNLIGVHADLVKVVRAARDRVGAETPGLGFIVTEGKRSAERQRALVAAGASRTLNSRHLTGHAVDVAATLNGRVSWDWPLYSKIAAAMKAAAAELGVAIKWGGDWVRLKDGPHFELSRAAYPAAPEQSPA